MFFLINKTEEPSDVFGGSHIKSKYRWQENAIKQKVVI